PAFCRSAVDPVCSPLPRAGVCSPSPCSSPGVVLEALALGGPVARFAAPPAKPNVRFVVHAPSVSALHSPLGPWGGDSGAYGADYWRGRHSTTGVPDWEWDPSRPLSGRCSLHPVSTSVVCS